MSALLALAAPSYAAADQIAIGTSPDPVEDVTYQVSVTGETSGTGLEVFATVKATGGQPCAANAAADDGVTVFSFYEVSGQFNLATNRSAYASGSYLLCAWLASFESAPPTAVASQVFTVRAPFSSGSVGVPAQVTAGRTFQLSVTAQTEVARELFVAINSPGASCGANYDANRTHTGVFRSYETTGGPFTHTSNVEAPSKAGLYGVCGYVQESQGDTAPEAAFGGQFKVISRRCPLARRNAARYEQRIADLKLRLQGPVLERGDHGSDVELVQRHLHIKPDGVFDQQMERAVKRFQRRHGLPVDGRINPATRKAVQLRPFISLGERRRYKAQLDDTRDKLAKAAREIRQYCV